MPTEPYPNESRLSGIARVETALKRLEGHMITLVQENQRTREMLEEERSAQREQFQKMAYPPGQSPGPHRPAGAGGSPA